MKKENQNLQPSGYDRIRQQVSQNIMDGVADLPAKKSAIKWKRLLLAAVYTLVICAVSVTSTFFVTKAYASGVGPNGPDEGGNNIGPGVSGEDLSVGDESEQSAFSGKRLEIAYPMLDQIYFFFGNEGCLNSVRYILASNFISEADKDRLQEVEKENHLYSIYFGKKDGVDYVMMRQLTAPHNQLLFKSALPYSFDDVLQQFENLSGEKLGKSFLDGEWASERYSYREGISVCFQTVSGDLVDDSFQKDKHCKEGNCTIESYCAVINNQLYLVTRDLVLEGELFGDVQAI